MNNIENPQSDKPGIEGISCYEALDSSHTNITDIIPFSLFYLLCYYRSNPIIIHVKGLTVEDIFISWGRFVVVNIQVSYSMGC